jgi:hypothetical protein
VAKTNQELAQEQLDSMGIPWKGAEMKPFSPSINPFNPNFRATIGSKLREWIDDSGIGGGYRQGLINAGEGIETGIDFTPIVGDAVGIGDIRTSYNQGDMLGTGINTVAAAVGALPIVGDVAAKGVKGVGSALRNIYHGTSSDAAQAIDQFGFDLGKTADGSAWFTTNPDIGEVAATGQGGIVKRQIDDSQLKLASYAETDKYTNGQLQDMGYDGAYYPDQDGGTQYEIWNQDKLNELPTLTIGDTPLAGAPSLPRIPERGPVRIGPNPEIAAAAQDYSQRSGIPSQPIVRYVSVDEPRATQVAREYDLMRHDPQNPEVKRSYDAMIQETLGQYESLLARGIEPYFINDVDPYQNSPYEALIDLEQNKRLGIFPTRSGFGSDANFDPRDNPLLGESGYNIGGQPALNNDIFRFVHDAMGHGRGGVGFRAMGEENAYQSHAGMYSPLARRALASETRGQNSFLNYGPNAEANRTASVADTIFADQKTGLMPRYASESGLIINDDKRERFFDALRRGETGLEGAITDDGKLRIIHRSNQPIERVDPEMYGGGLSRTSAERNRAGSPDFVKRSYYGIPASENPYRREVGIGSIQNEVLIEPELLYDARKDPDKLWIPNDPTGSEKRIADSNYTGYFVDHPKLGKVASIFDPYDVTKTYMIPLATGAGALGAVSSLRDMQEESTQPQPAL